MWLNGLSYERYLAGGYPDPVGCWKLFPSGPKRPLKIGIVPLGKYGWQLVSIGAVKVGLVPAGSGRPAQVWQGNIGIGLTVQEKKP